MVLGLVVGIHIDESILTDGMVDMAKFRPLARLGYMDYTVVDNVFTMLRPDMKKAPEFRLTGPCVCLMLARRTT